MTTRTPVWMGPKRGGGLKREQVFKLPFRRAGVVEMENRALIVLPVCGPAPVATVVYKGWRRRVCCNHCCSPKPSIAAPQPGQKRLSSASSGSPTRMRVSNVHGRDVRLVRPSSAPTKEVMSVARCAAFSAWKARSRSGALSLNWASIRAPTCACHHFCFVQAASMSSSSMDSAASMAASVEASKWAGVLTSPYE